MAISAAAEEPPPAPVASHLPQPSNLNPLSPILPPPANPSYASLLRDQHPSNGSSTSSAAVNRLSTNSSTPLHHFSFANMDLVRKVVGPKVSSVFNGMPSIAFSDEEVTKLSENFSKTIVGKFDHGIPKIFDITKMLKDLKLKAGFSVSFMDKRHVIIKLALDEDFLFLWLLENPNVNGYPLRFFKWSPMFSLEDESPVVPVWVSLENLPIFLFDKEALYEIGKLLGKPVRIDGYTANRSKLSQASICVELDVSKTLPKLLWIKVLGKGTAVKVSYANVPFYCHFCKKLGHVESHCLAKENPEGVQVSQPHPNDGFPPPAEVRRPFLNQDRGANSILGAYNPNFQSAYRGGRGGRGVRGGRGGRGTEGMEYGGRGGRPNIAIPRNNNVQPHNQQPIDPLPSRSRPTSPIPGVEVMSVLPQPALPSVNTFISPNQFGLLREKEDGELDSDIEEEVFSPILNQEELVKETPVEIQGMAEENNLLDRLIPSPSGRHYQPGGDYFVPEFEPLNLIRNRRKSFDGFVNESGSSTSVSHDDALSGANETIRMVSLITTTEPTLAFQNAQFSDEYEEQMTEDNDALREEHIGYYERPSSRTTKNSGKTDLVDFTLLNRKRKNSGGGKKNKKNAQ